jgi:hypothetical protein
MKLIVHHFNYVYIHKFNFFFLILILNLTVAPGFFCDDGALTPLKSCTLGLQVQSNSVMVYTKLDEEAEEKQGWQIIKRSFRMIFFRTIRIG